MLMLMIKGWEDRNSPSAALFQVCTRLGIRLGPSCPRAVISLLVLFLLTAIIYRLTRTSVLGALWLQSFQTAILQHSAPRQKAPQNTISLDESFYANIAEPPLNL